MDGQTTKLIWSAPLDFGHRSKVNYKIVCVIGCVQQEPFVTNYTQIAIPVEPDTLYKFRVYSQNSLSGFYPFEALRFDETEFRTAKSCKLFCPLPLLISHLIPYTIKHYATTNSYENRTKVLSQTLTFLFICWQEKLSLNSYIFLNQRLPKIYLEKGTYKKKHYILGNDV